MQHAFSLTILTTNSSALLTYLHSFETQEETLVSAGLFTKILTAYSSQDRALQPIPWVLLFLLEKVTMPLFIEIQYLVCVLSSFLCCSNFIVYHHIILWHLFLISLACFLHASFSQPGILYLLLQYWFSRENLLLLGKENLDDANRYVILPVIYSTGL